MRALPSRAAAAPTNPVPDLAQTHTHTQVDAHAGPSYGAFFVPRDRPPSGSGASFVSASSLLSSEGQDRPDDSVSLDPSVPGGLAPPLEVGSKRQVEQMGIEADDARPAKKRRGLAGALVDGAVTASIVAGAAVFGAYSLWNSWGRKSEDREHPSLLHDARTDFEADKVSTRMFRPPKLYREEDKRAKFWVPLLLPRSCTFPIVQGRERGVLDAAPAYWLSWPRTHSFLLSHSS